MGELFVPNKQRIKAIERLEIEPRDFEATAKFWRRLGFQVTIKGDGGRREASLRSGEVRILFHEVEDGGDRRRSPFTRVRITIAVRDFDAYVVELRSKGEQVPEPAMGPASVRGVEVVDPNGIRILLEEAASSS